MTDIRTINLGTEAALGLNEDGRFARDHMELLEALRAWPQLPSPSVLHTLSFCGTFPDDHKRGLQVRAVVGHVRVPFVTECEIGAGLWDRITDGAWRT